MPKALVLGGTGALRESVGALARAGWEVTATGRDPRRMPAKAVHVDAQGRHLNSPVPPQWDGPTAEQQPTMAYHGEPYDSPEGYGANKAEAERVVAAAGEHVSVLGPSKIHGPGVRQAREWAVVRRVLDRRPTLPVVDVPDSAPESLGRLPWTQDNVLDTRALSELRVPGWIHGGSVDYEAEDAWMSGRAVAGRSQKG